MTPEGEFAHESIHTRAFRGVQVRNASSTQLVFHCTGGQLYRAIAAVLPENPDRKARIAHMQAQREAAMAAAKGPAPGAAPTRSGKPPKKGKKGKKKRR